MQKLSLLLLFFFVIVPLKGMFEKKDRAFMNDFSSRFSEQPLDIQRAIVAAYAQTLLENPAQENVSIILQAIIPAQIYWTDEDGKEQRDDLFSTAEKTALLRQVERAVSNKTPTQLSIPYTLLKKLGLDLAHTFQDRPSALDLYKANKIRVSVNEQGFTDILFIKNNMSYHETPVSTVYNLSKVPCATKYKNIIEKMNINHYNFSLFDLQPLALFQKLRFLSFGTMTGDIHRKNIIHTIPKYCLAHLSNLEALEISNTNINNIDKKAFIFPQNAQSNLKYIEFSNCNFFTKDNVPFLANVPSSVHVYWEDNRINGKEVSAQELKTLYPNIHFKEGNYYQSKTTQQVAAWNNL